MSVVTYTQAPPSLCESKSIQGSYSLQPQAVSFLLFLDQKWRPSLCIENWPASSSRAFYSVQTTLTGAGSRQTLNRTIYILWQRAPGERNWKTENATLLFIQPGLQKRGSGALEGLDSLLREWAVLEKWETKQGWTWCHRSLGNILGWQIKDVLKKPGGK